MSDSKYECPFCHHRANVLSDPKTRQPRTNPEPGDLTVCLHCGEVLEFQPGMTLDMASLAKLMQLSPEQHRQITSVQVKVRNERTEK